MQDDRSCSKISIRFEEIGGNENLRIEVVELYVAVQVLPDPPKLIKVSAEKVTMLLVVGTRNAVVATR